MAVVQNDVQRKMAAGVAGAAGTVTLTIDPPPAGQFFYIERIVVSTADGSGTSALVYVGPVSAANLIAGTTTPALDFDDEPQPGQLVLPTEVLSVVFAGVTAGVQALARIQFSVWEWA